MTFILSVVAVIIIVGAAIAAVTHDTSDPNG